MATILVFVIDPVKRRGDSSPLDLTVEVLYFRVMSENDFPANWYQDPTGRHEQRYYDGANWTDSVVTAGVPSTDPMEQAAPVQPAAGTDDGGPGSTSAFLASLGPTAYQREQPELPLALGGVGGLLVGSGIIALIGQGGSRGAILGASALVLAIAFAAAFKLLGEQPWLRAAATAMCAIGIVGFVGGLILAGSPGSNAPGAFFLITGVLHLGAWVLPGFRGRPFMLGAGIVATALGIAVLIASTDSDCGFGGCNDVEEALGRIGVSTAVGVVLLFLGCAMLLAIRKLDGDGFHGTAETVAAGAIGTLLVGAIALSAQLGSTGNSLLVMAVGLGMGFVGHQGGRRALTWVGAALLAGGVISFVTNFITTDDPTAGSILLIVLGAALVAVPRFVQLNVANR